MCLQDSLHLSWIKSVAKGYGICINPCFLLTSDSLDAFNPKRQTKNMHVTNLHARKWWQQAVWSVIKSLSSRVKGSCCSLKARTQVPTSGSFSVFGCATLLFLCFEVHELPGASFCRPWRALAQVLSKVWSVSSDNGLVLVVVSSHDRSIETL